MTNFERVEPVQVNPRISPEQENKHRCRGCTHPLNWHDLEGCRYGCGCTKPHGKKKREPKALEHANGHLVTPPNHDTLFAAALDRAAAGFETAAQAMRDAATEARLARAAALAAPAVRMPEILTPPTPKPAPKPAPKAPPKPAPAAAFGPNPPAPAETLARSVVPSVADMMANATMTPEMEDLIRALSSGARKVLAAANLYPAGAKTTQLVAQTALSARTIQNNLVDLRRVGFIASGAPIVTLAGKAFLATNPVDFTPRALGKGEISVLKALDVCKGRATTRLVAMHTKLSQRTIQNILVDLRREGFVTRGELSLTAEGTARLGDDATPILAGQALIEARASELPDGEATVFSILVTLVDGEETSTSNLADRTGLSQRTIQNILVELRRRVLVARDKGAPPRVSDEIAHAVRESRAAE